MNSMSLYSVGYYDDSDEFKRIVALSRNPDMLDFAHNAYAVNEEEFPIKARRADAGSTRGKRKIVEILDSDDEAHDEPNPEDPTPECAEPSGNEDESDSVEPTNPEEDEPHSQNLPPLIPIDDDAEYEGEFRVLQRQRAERASAGLNFFSPDVDVHRQRRHRHESPLRRGGGTLEGNSSGSVFPCEPAFVE